MNARLLSSVVLIGALVSFATGQTTTSSPNSTNSTANTLNLTTILSSATRTVKDTSHHTTTWPKSWSTGGSKPSLITPVKIKEGETPLSPESMTATVSESPLNPPTEICTESSPESPPKGGDDAVSTHTEVSESPASHSQMSGSPSSETGMSESPLSHTGMSESLSSETAMSENPLMPVKIQDHTETSESPSSHTGISESLSSHTGISESPIMPGGIDDSTETSESPLSHTGISESLSSETGMSQSPLSHTGLSESLSSETGMSEIPITPEGINEESESSTSYTESSDISTPSTETLEQHTNTPLTPNTETDIKDEIQPVGEKQELKEVIRRLKETQQDVGQVKKQVNKLVDLYAHKIDTSCNIDVVSVPASSRDRKGSILVNKHLCAECHPQRNPGLSVCVIDPVECRSRYSRHFNTCDPDVVADGVAFSALVSSELDHVTIVGTSCGDSLSGLGEGRVALKVHGVDVDDLPKTGMYGFIIQTKEPSKGMFRKARGDHPSELKIKFRLKGKDTNDYGYEVVGHD